MGRLERDFQAKLIKELKVMFKGCIIVKNDPNYIQGIPDLLILYNDRWAGNQILLQSDGRCVKNGQSLSFCLKQIPDRLSSIFHGEHLPSRG